MARRFMLEPSSPRRPNPTPNPLAPMRTLPTLPILRGALATSLLITTVAVAAQGQSARASDPDSALLQGGNAPLRFAGGVTAGSMAFTGGRNEQALSLLLQFRPLSWLSLSAAPGFGRTTFGTTSSTGPTDIPVYSTAQYSPASLSWSPTVTASLSTAFSTGQASSTLGIGRNAFAAGGALSVSPASHTYIYGDGSKPITSASGNGSVDFGVSQTIGLVTPSLGYSAEIGSADSAATLARSLGGGIALLIADPITLAVDGSHGLTPGAPRWTFSVSLGTAYSGISPLGGGSIFGRLKNAFGSRATSSSGYSKTSSSTTSCKKMGTC